MANWYFIRACLLVALLTDTFNLGRLSIEFSRTPSDWAVLFSSVVTLISCLIGLAAGEFARNKPKGS
jgi:hypothetical protein